MTEAFLETSQQRFVAVGLDIDHAIRKKAGLCQCRGKKILPCHAPQHFALCACRNSGGEQSRRRPVDRPVAAARHLMQGTERQSPARQNPVDDLDSEGQDVTAMRRRAERLDAPAQLLNDKF